MVSDMDIIAEESALNGKAKVDWTFANLVKVCDGIYTGTKFGRRFWAELLAPVHKSFDNWLLTLYCTVYQ